MFRQRKSHASTVMQKASVITSGSMAQVLVVHVLKFIMTVVLSTVVAALIVRLAVNVTASWKFGTTYLLSLKAMARVTIPN